MKVALLSANLGKFDNHKDPVKQETKHEVVFKRFTYEDFPKIADLPPRFQYRIPKLFGWQMFPGHDVYIWFDGACSLLRPDCVDWYLEQLGDADFAFFKHYERSTIQEEVEFIERKVRRNHPYIVPRYGGGLHREQLTEIQKDKGYTDNVLYTSTAFVYRNSEVAQRAMWIWWALQSRYYTCDQVAQPYAMYKAGAKVNMINEHQFKIGYLSLVSHHK